MKSDKKYFLFPKPHLNYLFFLFYFISSLVRQILLREINKQGKGNLSLPILKLYIYEIGDFFSIIPYLIIKKKVNAKNITKPIDNNNNEKNEFIYNDIELDLFNRKRKQKIINIVFISLTNFIALISTTIFYLITGTSKMTVKHANLNIVYIFNILFLFLLSKVILDIEFYSHHYFSLIIFLICLIVISFIDFIDLKEKNENPFIDSLLYIVIRIFVVLLYAIESILAKIMFLKYYISPYLLLLIKTIFKFFLIVIFSIPFCFIKFKERIIFTMFRDIFENKLMNILYYIIYLFICFFYNLLNYLIIDKFSPSHLAIAYIFENLGIFIINAALKAFIIDYKFGIRLAMYILLIIASIIFNEFLVINICGLANNTQLFLDYKEINDLSLIDGIYIDNFSNEHFTERNDTSVRKTETNLELIVI